ncbi:MAG: hypothetical protein K2W96_17485, partial [Gemmataceae bacterium]|nr:hypothetical protein [Gemmataceae bacterium]
RAAEGGGIYNEGNLTLDDSSVKKCEATALHGGGVYNKAGAFLTMMRSVISENSATFGSGGGLANFGNADIVDVLFSTNSAGFAGGGILNSNGFLDLRDSEVYNNTVLRGGGIASLGANASTNIYSSTIRENTATNAAGTGRGGGVFSEGNTFLQDTVIARNNADLKGGGVFVNTGNVSMKRGSVTQNGAAAAGTAVYTVQNQGTFTPWAAPDAPTIAGTIDTGVF